MSELIIQIQDVHKTYLLGQRQIEALRGVDLDLHEGGFIAIAGPSGSGKSTLLNLVGCLDVPTTGRVVILNQDSLKLTDRAQATLRNRFIGFIFQSFNLVPVLSAYENVEYPLILLGISKIQRLRRVDRILDEVGLIEHSKHRPDYLSGGQRQRVAIARALVTQPRLVLADEPTANLDSHTGSEILELMRRLNQEHRTSFIFSTHDPRVMAHADQVYQLQDGKLIA